jgi:uncharacterized membrane protein YphA (DoxX/SURF4 family)
MSVERSTTGSATGGALRAWLPVCLRAVVVAMVLPAAATKLVDYEGQAAFFAEIGVPAADVTVLVVAAVQLVAVAALLFGVATRLAALALVPVMLTAMALHAVVFSNVAVLLGSVAIAVLGPGKYARWELDGETLGRIAGRGVGGS